MLDMGFIHDLKRIMELLPAERQSLLFSATFSPRIRRLAVDLLREPVSIDVAPRNAAAAPVRHVIHPVDRGRKRHLLSHMLRRGDIDQALVFMRTKRGANRLAEQLGKDGIRVAAIHGNKSQPQRVKALTAFKAGHSQVLVATDIAARGLDIESLPHVVNFELPSVPEDYVHRIGRTGRAGQAGTAISLVSVEEQELMAAIEKLLKRTIEREVVAGFEPSFSPRAAASPLSATARPAGRTGDGVAPRQPRPDGRGRGARGSGRREPGRRRHHPDGAGSEASGRPAPMKHAPGQPRRMPGERLTGRSARG
jgi:ATP-dependent RNA helicase RhlE